MARILQTHGYNKNMIQINENTAINFRHLTVDNANQSVPVRPSNRPSSTRVTECEIVKVEGSNIVEVLGYGKSQCHPTDNFNKEFGRKNSLSRALQNLDQDFRRQIWTAYFQR